MTALVTTPVTPAHPHANAVLDAHIKAAVSRPDAKGMKGFLLWVQAAWPKKIADPIIKAAHAALVQDAAASAAGPVSIGSYMGPSTFGRLGRMPPALPARLHSLRAVHGLGALGATGTASSTSVVAATPSTAATPSWMSSITSAISALGQAYLTKTQISDAQTIFDTNLQRAQAGLAPLPTNPANYGLPSPQLNVGLASGTQNLLLYGGIAAGVIAIGYIVMRASKG